MVGKNQGKGKANPLILSVSFKMVGVLLLDELGKKGVFIIGSKRHRKFIQGKKVSLLPITKRRLEVLK